MKNRPALSLEAIRDDFTNALYSPIPDNPDQKSLEVALVTTYPWLEDMRDRIDAGDHSAKAMENALSDRVKTLEATVTELYPGSDFAAAEAQPGYEVPELKTI